MIFELLTQNWAPIFSIITIILIMFRILFSEVSKHNEAKFFGIDARLINFSLRDAALKVFNMLFPMLYIFAFPLFIFWEISQFDVSPSAMVIGMLTFMSGFIIFLGISITLLQNNFLTFTKTSHFSLKNIISILITFAIPLIMAFCFGFLLYDIDLETPRVWPVIIIQLYFLTMFTLLLLLVACKLKSGYFSNNENKEFSITSVAGKTYFVALRHASDKWILMRCNESEENKLGIFKGEYVIKSLDGLVLTHKQNLAIYFETN